MTNDTFLWKLLLLVNLKGNYGALVLGKKSLDIKRVKASVIPLVGKWGKNYIWNEFVKTQFYFMLG